MHVELLTPEIVIENKHDIAQFYFYNAITCSFSEHYSFEEAEAKIEDFIVYLKKGDCIGYGLFCDKSICGFIWAYPHQFREERRLYISEIHIRENYRNKGYGKLLLEAVEAEASNKSAIRFYESCGYEKERIQFRKEIK